MLTGNIQKTYQPNNKTLIMNKKLSLSLALALCMSLVACEKEPFKPEPKPDPKPIVPVEPEQPKEPEQPQPKAFEAIDFKEDMLKDGILTLPEHFISITLGSLEAKKAQIKSIVAPGVTEIISNTFTDWTMLTAIDLPQVTKIGNKAFEGCNGITKIELPELVEVGEEAFAYCAGIKTLSLPKLSKVGNKSFIQCHNLTKVELPEATELGEEAFANCLYLAEINLPKLNKLGNKAFTEDYSLHKVTFGETMPQIEEGATPFLNTSVAKELFVPASAEATYTDWANKTYFISLNGDKSKLTQNFGALPSGLTINNNEGEETLLREDEDSEVTMKDFVLDPKVTVIEGGTFSGFEHPDDEIEGYFQAFGIKKVEAGTFQSQSNLTRVELPNATNMATGVFSDNTKLSVIVLPKLQHIQQTVFERTGIEVIHLPSATKIDKHAFSNCGNLKYLILGATPPSTPKMMDKNTPLNDSIFGLDQGGNPVKTGQVTIVVPDGSEAQYTAWASQYTQVKDVIPVSKFRK